MRDASQPDWLDVKLQQTGETLNRIQYKVTDQPEPHDGG